MLAARALIADGPAPPRRRKRLLPWILLGSGAAHLLVLAGLAVGVQVMPALVEPPVLSIELLRPSPLIVPPTAPPQAQEPLKTATPSPARPSTPPSAPPTVVPAATAPAKAPPGFKARGLTGGGDALRQAARAATGCRNADDLALTRAERAVCDETLGEKNKNRPAMFAVIDPDKKAIFDKVCAKDDDWCLYRTGKGPYPGIFALGKKKKRDEG